MTPVVRNVKVPVELRLTRRQRLAVWWHRRRMNTEQRELVDSYEKHLEELALYGTNPPHRIVQEEAGDE